MAQKYYIKKIYTKTGEVYYKAHQKAQGWYGESDKDIAWKFSKSGAKKIIERYEYERDNFDYIWSKNTIWELEEAEA